MADFPTPYAAIGSQAGYVVFRMGEAEHRD